MLRWRLTLGTALILSLAIWCWIDFQVAPAGIILFPLAVLVAVGASQEFISLLEAAGYEPHRGVVYAGNLLIVLSNGLMHVFPSANEPVRLIWPIAALGASFLLAIVAEMRRYEKPGGVVARLSLAVFGLIYIGMQLSCCIQLRAAGGPRVGAVAFVSMIAIVKACDTGAYAVGRLIGRHKMAPVLSPGKTWEGAAGGIAFACLAAWLTLHIWMPSVVGGARPPGGRWAWAICGVVIGLAGMLGDLAESLIKRDVGRKDSSAWMPGFGGILDIVDSPLIAAPVALALWLARGWLP